MLIAVVILGIVLIALASRRGLPDEPDDHQGVEPVTKITPRAEDAPTTNLEELREQGFDPKDLEGILSRPPETWTIRDRKVVNIAKRADSGLSERINSLERTARERAEHQELEDVVPPCQRKAGGATGTRAPPCRGNLPGA